MNYGCVTTCVKFTINTGQMKDGDDMNRKHRIEISDIVAVNFNNAQCTLTSRAIVLKTPAATGDSWVFIDSKTKEVHYVSEGCTITKLEEKP